MRHRLNRIARPINFIRSDSPDQSSETQRSLRSAFTSGWRLKLCTQGGIKHDRGERCCVPPAKPPHRLLEIALTKSVILKLKTKKRAINICLPRMCHELSRVATRSPFGSDEDDKWLVPRKKSAPRKRSTGAVVVICPLLYCRIGIWPITRSRWPCRRGFSLSGALAIAVDSHSLALSHCPVSAYAAANVSSVFHCLLLVMLQA